MRTLKFALVFLFAAIIAVLSVANSAEVAVRLWPDLTEYGVPAAPQTSIPLFVFGLLAGLVGFLLGAAREWAREGRVRGAARRARREAETLRAKVDELGGDRDDDLPALPSR